MSRKVYAPNGAGIVALDDDMPNAPKRFQTKIVELSAVHHFSKIQLSTSNLIRI
jgi:hypothetical protein